MKKEADSTELAARKLIGNTSFSVSARVAMQLGRESISSSVTAILELVKNAYDADANLVRVRFGSLSTTEARLVIEDDGRGMTSKELMANWMVIGTSNKAQSSKSKGKGRVLTGEKGLGRLGLDRLCGRTRVQSKSQDAEPVELDVDWAKYEKTASRLEEIVHPLFEISDFFNVDPFSGDAHPYDHGTRLILDGLKDRWDEVAISELYSELSLLISPFHAQHDFRVELDTGGAFKQFEGIVAPDAAILANANWRVVGTIDENDIVDMRMSSPFHETEFHPQPAHWTDFAKGQGDKPRCGALRFEFYFFDRGDVDDAGHSFTKPQLNQFLKSNQGIRIYRDGFRVKPYGEPNGEGDWLRLGYRRTINPEGVKQKGKGNWKLGYNQVVGAVFLSREKNTALIDQTNREGLVLGEGYRHLYIFADRVLMFFERQRQKFEKAQVSTNSAEADETAAANDSAASANSALVELSGLAEKIVALLDPTATSDPKQGEVPIKDGLERVSSTLGKAVKALEESVKQESTRRIQTEQEKNTLANLASLGILTACFGHETTGWAGTVQINSGWLYDNLAKHLFMVQPAIEAQVIQIVKDIRTDSKKLHTFAAFALGNIRPDKRRQRVFCIKTVALEVFAAFRESLQTQKGISTDLSDMPSHECLIRAYRMDWESIFANLITNAMWAITRHHGERKIRLSIVEEASHFALTFEDSGYGLEAGTEEQIFDAGFSTRRNGKGEQEGTGMGLFIVKSFVQENSGGTIRAQNVGSLGGARFIITVPKATKDSGHES